MNNPVNITAEAEVTFIMLLSRILTSSEGYDY